ncbi:MAG: hypothetical protein J6K01_02775 [Paludibacteraceae bacterium]|nr:hypothetical protein [Paludibacteraceae bacterium]
MALQLFFEQITSKYSDIIAAFAIPMTIAILALAFPLLFQAASRIDDKYNSTLLIKVFRKDKTCKFFISSLIITLSICFIWTLQMPKCQDIYINEIINTLISNSAIILLVSSTIVLVISTISVTRLMYIYYIPDKLLERLKKQYAKSKNEKELYFEAISEILFYSISKEGEPLARQLQTFYHKEFISFRKDKEHTTIDYPDYYYNILFDANERLCCRERKSISNYNHSFYDLFIDEYQHTTISQETFSFIWKCLCQSIFYKKEEFIFSYWKKANQYMSFSLQKITPILDNGKITNQENIDKRDQERERFLEFHYALCGHIMMKKEYTLLKKLTNYSNQWPPKYELFPERTEEIVTRFIELDKYDDYDIIHYERKYPFLDVDNIDSNEVIKSWIKRYFAFLFIRQYTRNQYFYNPNTTGMPRIPKKMEDKRKYIEQMDVLKSIVTKHLNDKELLDTFDFDEQITKEWFAKNNKKHPIDLIEEYKGRLNDEINKAKIEQEIDKTKKEQFNKCTIKILEPFFEEYHQLFNTTIINDVQYKSLFYNGTYQVVEKMAFSKDQDIDYSNYDSFIAESISLRIKRSFASIFGYYNHKRHQLKTEHLLTAIDKLKLNKTEYTIVSVGFNLNILNTNDLNDNKDNTWTYKGLRIIETGFSIIENFNQSLFIMKNEDLPYFINHEVDKDTIEKYSLEEINEKYHIYTNVIDLHKTGNEGIKKEIEENTTYKQLNEYALACVDIKVEIRCKENAKCIQLKVFDLFKDQGFEDNISNIKNIWNN